MQRPYVRQSPLSGQIMHQLLNELLIKIYRVYKSCTSSPVFIKQITLDPGNAYIWPKKVTFGVWENVYIFTKIGDWGDKNIGYASPYRDIP